VARIRSIKPDFFTSEKIASLPLSARLTFIGIWTHVDDNGVTLDNERLITAALWPLEDDPREALQRTSGDLARLSKERLIYRYEAGGKRYLFVTGWDEHQKISHPSKSRYPRPLTMEYTDPDPHSGNPPESIPSPPESLRYEQGAGSREQGAGSRESTPVLPVGQLTDRNARARVIAPTAQPVNSFAARATLARIPRYRGDDVPGWARRRLADMTAAALDAGFGADAIAYYAGLAIGSGEFKAHQHIPELRHALAWLGRDAALGTACQACGHEPGTCPCTPAADPPWSEADQADLEAALRHLAAEDELVQEA